MEKLKVIAHIRTEFDSKFAVPRQSGLVDELTGTIVFEPEYRVEEALRGLEGFSHIWLIWEFSKAVRDDWSPTVRPPRLGGNKRMGVFATRSPFRPNAIGLSCVRLRSVEHTAENGTVIHVAGADLMDGTPIFDIKPYLPYADCRPEATGGFAPTPDDVLEVSAPDELLMRMPESKRAALINVLAQDPRPSYQNDPERVYGFSFAGYEIKFTCDGSTIFVTEILEK